MIVVQAGARESFLHRLPGYPDGIVKGTNGTFWISIVNMKQPALQLLLYSRSPSHLKRKIPNSSGLCRDIIIVLDFWLFQRLAGA